MTVAWPAIHAIARFEWTRRKRSMLALGLAAGLVGGVVVGGAALLARSTSAPGRLVDAVAPGDAVVQVFGGPDLADAIIALPLVADHAPVSISVGRVEGSFVRFTAVAALPDGDLVRPVIVDGRRADSASAEEAMVSEALADALDLRPGGTLTLAMLTAEEVTQFDTGFGEPDGATVALEVVGVIRMPPGAVNQAPVIVTSAFADAHPESIAGAYLFVRLVGGTESLAAFSNAVDEVAAAAVPTSGSLEFLPAIVDDPRAGTRSLERSSRVLLGGLLTAIIVAVLASMLALGQALARHQGASADQQRVEHALGMTARDRMIARTLPWVVPGMVTGVVAASVALAAGGLEPVGPLRAVEPDPGWRFEGGVVVLGVGTVVAATLVAAGWSAWRAGRGATGPASRSGSVTGRVITSLAPRRRGWMLAGAVFAVSSGDGRSQSRVRTSLAAAVVGVAGMVGALTFAATLDRLVETPARWGWTTDVGIADVSDEMIDGFLRDERFSAVVDVASATVRVDSELVQAYSFEPRRGSTGWVYHSGRSPQWSGEIAVGTRAAERFGLELGDRIAVSEAGELEVVGIGLGPPLGGEPLGSSVLLDPDGLNAAAAEATFREVLLSFAPGVDADAITGELAAQYEILTRELPAEVRDVADLGRLPELLGVFLAVLATMAIGNSIVLTSRVRARDLAVLRALGSTPRQSGLALVAMSVATTVVGLVIGVPLGWAIARLVWGILAESIGIEGGVVWPVSAIGVVIGGAVLAVLLALRPARRVARADPAELLRAE